MESIHQIIKVIFARYPDFSEDFWRECRVLANQQRVGFANYLVEVLENSSNREFQFSEFQKILAVIQGVYPFDDSNLPALGENLAGCLLVLATNKHSFQPEERDHLLYLIGDILFHCPGVIEHAARDSKDTLVKGLIRMSALPYVVGTLSDAYLKNDKAIRVIWYFQEADLRRELIDAFSRHFDHRIREDVLRYSRLRGFL